MDVHIYVYVQGSTKITYPLAFPVLFSTIHTNTEPLSYLHHKPHRPYKCQERRKNSGITP